MSLEVSLVSADRTVWSGEAERVLARTLRGELGIMTGHTPLLGILAEGEVRITTAGGEVFSAEVDGGFLSVSNNRVLVVAPVATIGTGSGN